MRRYCCSLPVLVLVLFAVGCGGDGGTATAPTPSTTGIVLTLPNTLVVGQTQQATATASLSNGTSTAIATGFRSDSLNVATVSDSGLVTPVSNGTANIYVISGGRQGTANIHVVPGYQGQWRGSYIVRTCTSTGYWALPPDSCGGQVNRVLPATLSLTQSGTTVSGTFQLGTIPFTTFTAPVGADGSIAFSATSAQASTITIIANWNLNSLQDGRITGGQTQIWRSSGLSGEMQMAGTVVDWLNKTNGVLVPSTRTFRSREDLLDGLRN